MEKPTPPSHPGVTVSTALLRHLLAALTFTALTLAGSTVGHDQSADRVRLLAAFDPATGQNPENLAIARSGTIYVSWLFAHAVAQIQPGTPPRVVGLPDGLVSGVAIDPLRPDRLAVGLISANAGTSGIWTVPVGAFAGRAVPERRVALPTSAFPNGLTFGHDGTLYIADSARGAVLTVAPGTSTATTWLASNLFTPTGEAFHGTPLPGVNGVKLYRGQLYATNTARRLLLRVPVTAHGPGAPVVVRAGLAFDDFAIEPAGTFVAALNISDQVVRFTAAGPVTVLADRSHDGVENPSAVAISHNGDVLVTSAAYFGSYPALQLISACGRARVAHHHPRTYLVQSMTTATL
jgi:hypothetical protein